jgi:hypothetical protein
MNESRQLGDALARELASGPPPALLFKQRLQIVRAMKVGAAKQRRLLIWSSWAVACVLGLGLAFWSAAPLELGAQYRGRAVPESARLVAVAPAGEAIRFSDGTELVLAPHGVVTLTRLRPNEARLDLARGRLLARVRKGAGRNWSIQAGPFSVQVVGTEFVVEWDDESGRLEVAVNEGRVLVEGGDLSSPGRVLSAGERLVRQLAASSPAAPPELETPPSLDATREGKLPPAALSVSPGPSSGSAGVADRRPRDKATDTSWRKLAESSLYADALRSAEHQGFEALLGELPETDLMLLANTARYAGSASRAKQALLRLRLRFPHGRGSPVAALLLAGLAEDHARDLSEATTWLRAFLNESPHGDLAGSARARLLGILVRQGQRAEAQRVAGDYLRWHPAGPYANEARAVLGASGSP